MSFKKGTLWQINDLKQDIIDLEIELDRLNRALNYLSEIDNSNKIRDFDLHNYRNLRAVSNKLINKQIALRTRVLATLKSKLARLEVEWRKVDYGSTDKIALLTQELN